MPVAINDCPPIAVTETLAGTPSIVDLWYWLYEPASESALAAAAGALMTGDEGDRYRLFRFERDRRLFLATRLLVRTVLSRYAGVSPASWRFAADSSGKPHIAAPAVTPALHFNLANTHGLVVCAVSVAHETLGVDAERIDRQLDFGGVARRCFSSSEAAALQSVASSELPRRFFEYWVLKESYVKALGVGLAAPLSDFSFTIGERRADVSFEARPEEGDRWQFALLDAPPAHLIAVGAQTDGVELSVRASQVAPVETMR